jgi:hypothetical protein
MANLFVNMEFKVASLADIRFLWKAWQRLVVLEGLKSSESALVHVIVEDRVPGEEVKLCFMAAQEVLHKFLQSLKDSGLNFNCHELIPNILTLCRIVREPGAVTVIGPQNCGG